VVLGTALRGSHRTPALRPLLAASLALLVVLGGTAVLIGNRGLNFLPTDSASAPIETATAPGIPVPTTNAATSPSPAVLPTPAPTAAPSSPSSAEDGPLQPGEIAAMVTDGRLVIRTMPGTGADSAIFPTKLYPGQRVLTIEGPVDASGYPWYRVRLGDVEGWVAAMSRDGEPWLAPIRNGLIAFVRDTSDGSGEAIVTVGPDGTTGEAVLLADPSLSQFEQLAWSPDGRRLAFVGTLADSPNDSTEIFVVDADGSNLLQLTQNEFDDDSPAWSPGSTHIAFRAVADPSAPVDSKVLVIRADGSGARVLGPGANPVWSPDGLQLAMTVADGGSSFIWVQAADGGGRRQVSEVSVAVAPPAWSPDGQHLVFSSSGLSLVEVSSGVVTPLTAEPGSMPIWSMSRTIAFSTTGSASAGVFVIYTDGSGLRRASEDPRVVARPRWSPDGRSLLLGDDGGSPVAILDLGSWGVTSVGEDSGAIRSPAWQPLLTPTEPLSLIKNGSYSCEGGALAGYGVPGDGFAIITATSSGDLTAQVMLRGGLANTTYTVQLIQSAGLGGSIEDCSVEDGTLITDSRGDGAARVREARRPDTIGAYVYLVHIGDSAGPQDLYGTRLIPVGSTP
jgi:Tol biopolymer transport system component